MQRSIERMEGHLMRMADAIAKLAVIEDRQANDRSVILKMQDGIDKIDARLDALERVAPANERVSGWVHSALWAAAGLACYIVINKLGLM